MATGGDDKVGYSFVKVGTLTLENAERDPYTSFVVCEKKIVVIDSAWKVRIHRLQDGKFLGTSDSLESTPRDMCLMDAMEICILQEKGLIKMMSIDCTDMSTVFTKTRCLRLQGVLLDRYDGVARFKNSLVVTGIKQGMISWCIVSLDGHVDTFHQICKGCGPCYVATKDNMMYILCNPVVESIDTGVYGFDILNPSQFKYKYTHERLQDPRLIVINENGVILVCNGECDPCIHQLTASCEIVSIFTLVIPWDLNSMFWYNKDIQGETSVIHAIFWDHERLYVYGGSKDITVFRSNYQGSDETSEVQMSEEREQPIIEETSIKMEQGNRKKYPSLDLTESQKPRHCLPSGKKYHAFFSYAHQDMQWVKDTVKKLEEEHGFVCCEYDRDNTPGTPLIKFAETSIRYAYKTVVVMTCEAFESNFVNHEIDMVFIQGFDEKRKCIVPVLLKDCKVPVCLRALNYVDARDQIQREIWWPKLLSELQTQDMSSEVFESNQMEQGDIKEENPQHQLYITTKSGTWV